jgi:hypothetical protein
MAILILTGQVETVRVAAKQMAPRADGGLMSSPASKQRRLQRNYQKREQWFIIQAKARLVANRPSPRAARSGIAAYLDSMNTLQQFAEEHERHMATVQQFADSQRRFAEAAHVFVRAVRINVPVGAN